MGRRWREGIFRLQVCEKARQVTLVVKILACVGLICSVIGVWLAVQWFIRREEKATREHMAAIAAEIELHQKRIERRDLERKWLRNGP